MSLGDKLRILRAQHGGVTPAEIEAALPELPKGLYRYMEQRYTAVGDDASIGMLAEYFGVSFDDLRWRLDWPRKALSRALVYAVDEDTPITLQLPIGEVVTGKVKWWDLGACGGQRRGPGISWSSVTPSSAGTPARLNRRKQRGRGRRIERR